MSLNHQSKPIYKMNQIALMESSTQIDQNWEMRFLIKEQTKPSRKAQNWNSQSNKQTYKKGKKKDYFYTFLNLKQLIILSQKEEILINNCE